MICPNCKCEYLAGVTQCSDCDVPLVDALDPSTPAPPTDEGIVPIWAGNDPRRFALLKEALEKAKVPFVGPGSTGYLIFPSMRPKMEICVPIEERERAEMVLLELGEGDNPDELTLEERGALALPESESVDHDEVTGVSSDAPEDWDDQEPVSEVWKGDTEDFANTLVACFSENGIPSHKLTEGSHWRLIVRPAQEAQAREIVREVVEATPPE